MRWCRGGGLRAIISGSWSAGTEQNPPLGGEIAVRGSGGGRLAAGEARQLGREHHADGHRGAVVDVVEADAGALDDEDRRSLPERIDLPRGWQPEGITTDGRSLYVGSLKNGALWKGSPRSTRGQVLAKGRKGRVAVGVDYDRRRNLVWVAGGGAGTAQATRRIGGR